MRASSTICTGYIAIIFLCDLERQPILRDHLERLRNVLFSDQPWSARSASRIAAFMKSLFFAAPLIWRAFARSAQHFTRQHPVGLGLT